MIEFEGMERITPEMMKLLEPVEGMMLPTPDGKGIMMRIDGKWHEIFENNDSHVSSEPLCVTFGGER